LSVVSSAIAVLNTKDTRPIVIVTTGQSNAVGQRNDGPNPADPNVKVWDGVTNAWGSSDFTETPFSRSQPDGNLSKNSIGLAFAHRMSEETKRPVYLIHDAVGGKAIEEWMGAGTASVRYAALATKVVNALATTELAGVTKIDYLLWTQGEENALTDTFGQYLAKFTTLDVQFRAEAWMSKVTPMLVFGLAKLHERYEVVIAQEYYCSNENPNCIYVKSDGLLTRTSPADTEGDDTHFIGESLWEHGYYRAFNALTGARQTYNAPLFFSRGTGLYDGGNVAISNFNTLVSLESANARFPFNSPLSNGSIMWGLNCAANGSYTLAGGARVTTDSACLYSMGWGDTISFGANGDYSIAGGFQNVVNGRYGAVFGRGITSADDGVLYAGLFPIYTTSQADKVIFQHGNGTTSANRSNVIAARQSGIVEFAGSKFQLTPTATYNYAASMTADTVGDIRTIKVGTGLQVQNCTVADPVKGAGTWVNVVSPEVASLTTSTSTALSTTNSSVASLSTSTSTGLSTVDSSVASLSTSTSTALSTTNSTVASLSPPGLGTQWYATTFGKQVSQTITSPSSVSLASVVTDADWKSLLSDSNRVSVSGGAFRILPISGNTKEIIKIRVRLNITFGGNLGDDKEMSLQLTRADGTSLGALSLVKVDDNAIKPNDRFFEGSTWASGLTDPFYLQGFDIKILHYSSQNLIINNVVDSVQVHFERRPENIPVAVVPTPFVLDSSVNNSATNVGASSLAVKTVNDKVVLTSNPWTAKQTTIIGATTTAPAKPAIASIQTDYMRSRRLYDKYHQIQIAYGQGATVGTAGSGAYLFTLPNGLSFDVTAHPVYNVNPGVVDVTTLSRFGTLYVNELYLANQAAAHATLAVIVPFSATQFRVAVIVSSPAVTAAWVGSTAFALAGSGVNYKFGFDVTTTT
jgi:hypothetical protein